MDDIKKWQVKFREYISGLNLPRDDYRGIMEYIEEVPTIEPRPKGRWVKISPANIYECSKCGKTVMTDDICEYCFCHGCGADMRGGAQ